MRTDELADEFDVDHALRDLLPAMPRSRSWESAKRDELLAYISPGTSLSSALTKITDSEVEVAARSDVRGARRPRAMGHRSSASLPRWC